MPLSDERDAWDRLEHEAQGAERRSLQRSLRVHAVVARVWPEVARRVAQAGAAHGWTLACYRKWHAEHDLVAASLELWGAPDGPGADADQDAVLSHLEADLGLLHPAELDGRVTPS